MVNEGTNVNKVYFGDCRDTMRSMIDAGVRVQCAVTSPPYWGLRDYGHPGQLGLEPTPAEYVANMVAVFRLVRDLLADDGVLWLNLGSSYFGGGNGGGGSFAKERPGWSVFGGIQPTQSRTDVPACGADDASGMAWMNYTFKPKDMVPIPWMVAMAMQADGWWLRQDIIWHKPNPMPESVTDRCTKAHEYLLLMAKSERYYYDADAIKELGTNRASGVASKKGPASGHTNLHKINGVAYESRNKRSVWTVPTSPYSGAHFATFPPALIEPCILAGSRVGDIVLDPFMGSGTTGQVAQNLGRNWIGCELNTEYEPLQHTRTAQAAFAI